MLKYGPLRSLPVLLLDSAIKTCPSSAWSASPVAEISMSLGSDQLSVTLDMVSELASKLASKIWILELTKI